jgi:hypothetical protein
MTLFRAHDPAAILTAGSYLAAAFEERKFFVSRALPNINRKYNSEPFKQITA